MKPIEAAAKAICDEWDYDWQNGTDGLIDAARAAVIAYLKALVIEGPSPFMIERIDRLAEDPEFHWETMLKAYIAELEANR